MNDRYYRKVYSEAAEDRIRGLVDLVGPQVNSTDFLQEPSVLRDVNVILSGWGAPEMNEGFLAHCPNLKAVFYGAGSIRGVVTESFWERQIRITSALKQNAIPVAEYCLSQVLFALKRGHYFLRETRENKAAPEDRKIHGAYKSTVGIVSLGNISKHLCRLLKPMDIKIIAYDPFPDRVFGKEYGIEWVDLNTVFSRSDVVSIHAPLLDQTLKLITGQHLLSMKENAAVVFTSAVAPERSVLEERTVCQALKKREDIEAILDVSYSSSAAVSFLDLPNVHWTPGIAGSMDRECERMGNFMVDELERFIRGEALQGELSQFKVTHLA
ncbi:MAG: glycerate dehydrogenase [Opitutales bacterium]|nr:glycerate dehydrogenase [Opitutales bacterium]